MNKNDRVRFLGWSDTEGHGCVHPLIPYDVGEITDVITDPILMPGASPEEPMYQVEYRKGNGHHVVPFNIVHFEEEIELVIVPILEEVNP